MSLLGQIEVNTGDLHGASNGGVLLGMLLLVSLLGAAVVALLGGRTVPAETKSDATKPEGVGGGDLLGRSLAIAVSLATVVISALIAIGMSGPIDLTGVPAHDQLGETFRVMFDAGGAFSLDGPPKFSMVFGLDSVGLWLVVLTTVLTLVALVGGLSFVRDRYAAFAGWILLLQAAVIGAFSARDVLLFYFFFELTLVPAFFLIGGWGGLERRRAAMKFFIYTFAGSVFMLASILYVGVDCGTFEMSAWTAHLQHNITGVESRWVIAGLLAGLLVKVPLIPLHSWLPLTYTQAPAPVTALLSGVLAKLGTYGLLRLVVPALVEPTSGMQVASTLAHPTITIAVAVMAVVGILAAALIAWMQSDFKTLVAYSSISHLGFCVLALLALNTLGLQAALLYMINHGISTAGLFLILGMIERRVGTREMGLVSGLGRERPWLAFFLVLFVMSSIGLPLTNGFVSEFLSVMSAITADHLGWGMMILAAAGILLGAIYMLYMTAGLLFGPERIPATAGQDSGLASDQGAESASNDRASSLRRVPDLRFGEILGLAPLAVLVIVLGVRPGVILDHSKPELQLASQPIATIGSSSAASADVSAGDSVDVVPVDVVPVVSTDDRPVPAGGSLVRLESSAGRVGP